MMEKSTRTRAYLYLLTNFSLWGCLYVLSKFVLDKLPLFTVACLRYVIAVAVLLTVVHVRKLGKIEKGDWKYVFMVGFLGYFLSLGAQLIGTKLSNASLASLVNSTNPVFIMVMAAVLLKEKLTVRKILSILLALAGVYIILGGGAAGAQWAGIVISFFSVVLWSFVSVYVRKITQKYPPLLVTAYGMLVAAVCNLPIAAVELARTEQVSFDAQALVALLAMGVFCTGAAHLLWNQSLSMLEASTCSAFYPIQPLVSVVLGIVFLGERVSVSFVAGSILIVIGVLVCVAAPPAAKGKKVS